MPTDVIDATSSPSSRTSLRTWGRSCLGEAIEDIEPGALYAVTGDETVIVVAPRERGDPWDDASLETRWTRACLYANQPGRHTDYRVESHYNTARAYSGFEELAWLGRAYYHMAPKTSMCPAPAPIADVTAAIGRQVSATHGVRAVAEALGSAFRALAELDADQVQRVRESLETLQDLLISGGADAGLSEDHAIDTVTVSQPGEWAEKVLRLKELASLTDEEVAKLLGVTRSNVQGWLHRGQGMRVVRARHLLAVFKVLEDTHERMHGGNHVFRQVLLAPVGPAGQTSFDYLAQGKYLVARGYLQRLVQADPTRRDDRRRAPIRPAVRLPASVRLATLDELSPSPRVDIESG